MADRYAAAYWTAVLAASGAQNRADAVAALLGNGTKIKAYDAADSLIRTITTAAWTRGTLANGAYPITPGTFTDAGTGAGTPSYVVITKSDDTEICRLDAGVLTGSFRLPEALSGGVEVDAGTFATYYPSDEVSPPSGSGKRWYPGHYLYATNDVDHTGIQESRRNLVKSNPNWAGYICMYWWRKLEPTQGAYDFSMIEADLAKCEADGKRMIIRLMDRSFHGTARPEPLPDYIASMGGRWTFDNAIYARLWEPTVNERLCLLIEALYGVFGDNEHFQGIQMEESAMSGITSQSGYTHEKMAAWWLKMGARCGAAAGRALFFGNFNYGLSSSAIPSRDDVMAELALVHRIGLGASDARMIGDRNGHVLGYHFQWVPYAGTVPLLAGIEYNTYATDSDRPTRTAKDYLDYGVDVIKLNFMGWMARTSTSGVDFNIHDAIAEIDRQNGRIVSTRPVNAPAE